MPDIATLLLRVDANGAIRAVDQFGNSAVSAAKKSVGSPVPLRVLIRG